MGEGAGEGDVRNLVRSVTFLAASNFEIDGVCALEKVEKRGKTRDFIDACGVMLQPHRMRRNRNMTNASRLETGSKDREGGMRALWCILF